jgi:hypothetical protein
MPLGQQCRAHTLGQQCRAHTLGQQCRAHTRGPAVQGTYPGPALQGTYPWASSAGHIPWASSARHIPRASSTGHIPRANSAGHIPQAQLSGVSLRHALPPAQSVTRTAQGDDCVLSSPMQHKQRLELTLEPIPHSSPTRHCSLNTPFRVTARCLPNGRPLHCECNRGGDWLPFQCPHRGAVTKCRRKITMPPSPGQTETVRAARALRRLLSVAWPTAKQQHPHGRPSLRTQPRCSVKGHSIACLGRMQSHHPAGAIAICSARPPCMSATVTNVPGWCRHGAVVARLTTPRGSAFPQWTAC